MPVPGVAKASIACLSSTAAPARTHRPRIADTNAVDDANVQVIVRPVRDVEARRSLLDDAATSVRCLINCRIQLDLLSAQVTVRLAAAHPTAFKQRIIEVTALVAASQQQSCGRCRAVLVDAALYGGNPGGGVTPPPLSTPSSIKSPGAAMAGADPSAKQARAAMALHWTNLIVPPMAPVEITNANVVAGRAEQPSLHP